MTARRAGLALAAAALVIAGTAVVPPPARAASVTVTAPSATGSSGSEVKVPISATGAPGIGAMQFALRYDPSVLEATGTVDAGELLGDNGLIDADVESGRLAIKYASVDAAEGDGELFVAHFKVLGASGATSPLTLESAKAWEATNDGFEITVTASNGDFRVVAAASSFPWWIIAVVVAAALLVLVLLARRRRRDDTVTTPPPGTTGAVGVAAAPGGEPSSPTAAAADPVWSPTHVVPANGLPAYESPYATQVPVAQLDPGLPVQLLERAGDWARVLCSNGWTTWVDARWLEAVH